MTEREKAILSDRLFDEIGLIDDRFIYEASTPYVRKRNKGFGVMGRILVIAAALTLTLCIAVGTLLTGALFLLWDMGSKGDADMGIPPEDITADVENEGAGYFTLSERLDAASVGSYATVKKDDVELFDTKPKIVWRAAGADEYYVCEISDSRASTLIKQMRVGGVKTPEGETADGGITSVWIVLGNGQVVTPHLELTSGNVGYGELFDYEKEYEPSEDFSDLLIDTVS